MKIQIVKDKKGQVVGASKVTPRSEGVVEAERNKGETVEEVDVSDDVLQDAKALFKQYQK